MIHLEVFTDRAFHLEGRALYDTVVNAGFVYWPAEYDKKNKGPPDLKHKLSYINKVKHEGEHISFF